MSNHNTVLIADDEEIVRAVNCAILERFGYNVLTAVDGAEALAIFQDNSDKFCAIVLDLKMPRMNGQEAFRAIRKLRPTVPVVVTSGYDANDFAGQLSGEGHACFLQKPFAPRDLLHQINEVCAV